MTGGQHALDELTKGAAELLEPRIALVLLDREELIAFTAHPRLVGQWVNYRGTIIRDKARSTAFLWAYETFGAQGAVYGGGGGQINGGILYWFVCCTQWVFSSFVLYDPRIH